MRNPLSCGLLLLCAALCTAGCDAGLRPRAAAPAPAPQPWASPKPPDPPIIMAQTVVTLPPPQPIPPESVPPRLPVNAPPAAEPAEPPPTRRLPPASGPRPSQNVPEAPPAQPGTSPPVPVPAQPAPAVEDRSPAAEKVKARWAEIREMMRPFRNQSANARVESLLRLSQRSLDRADVRQAQVFAERAAAIARDLLGR